MKIYLLLLTLTITLYASNIRLIQANIISTITHALVHKSSPTIYMDDPTFRSIDLKPHNIKMVRYCLDADIIFTNNIDALRKTCTLFKHTLVFVLSYRDYVRYEDQVVGAFFWQKGRPNIIFNRKKLTELGISLPKQFEKYIE